MSVSFVGIWIWILSDSSFCWYTLESSEKWLKYLCPCHPHGRPDGVPGFRVQLRPDLSIATFGRQGQTSRWKISFSLCPLLFICLVCIYSVFLMNSMYFCCFAFQVNKKFSNFLWGISDIYKRIKISVKISVILVPYIHHSVLIGLTLQPILFYLYFPPTFMVLLYIEINTRHIHPWLFQYLVLREKDSIQKQPLIKFIWFVSDPFTE